MPENPDWVPHDVDVTVPNAARVYDYWLNGAHNFAADRDMANKIEQIMPAVRDGARIQRAFLRRAVLFLVESGIRQFLDIGSGIPTVGNVHEIAQRADPESRIMYVDKEPVAVTHSELLLQGNDRAAVIQANLRDVEHILDHPQTKHLLDLDQPIPAYSRSHEEVLRLFTGFELVEPGLVGCALWRPSGPGDASDSAEMNTLLYGGVARKP